MIVVDVDEGVGLIRKLPNRRPLLPPSRYLGNGTGEWPVLDYDVDFMDQEPSLLRMKNVRVSLMPRPWCRHKSRVPPAGFTFMLPTVVHAGRCGVAGIDECSH